MQWAFILGLIGTITGVISLTIHIMKYLNERAKINIYHETGVYFPVKFEEDKYDSPNRLVIFVRIENLSDKPNSVLEFFLEMPGYQKLSSDSSAEPLENYTISKTKSVTKYIQAGEKQLKPIFVLSAYEAREGFIFFPFCPIITEDFSEGIFTVVTSRKAFKIRVKIEKAKTTQSLILNK